MESTMLTYARGSIVRFCPPADSSTDTRADFGAPGPHPMLILNANAGESEGTCQCMLLSSKLNSYFGYRIYLNTMDRMYQGFSVICCTKVHTIEKRHLYDILGFAPQHLVDKCAMAYAWIIGLHDQIPDFYQEDEICMQYACGANANIPKAPVSRNGIIPGSQLQNFAVYSAKPRGSLSRDMWKLRNRLAPNLEDGIVMEAPKLEDMEPLEEIALSAMTKTPAEQAVETGVYCVGYNLTMPDLTEEYEKAEVSEAPTVMAQYKTLTDEDKFFLYTKLKTVKEVLIEGKGMTSSTAYRVAKYAMKQIVEQRKEFISKVKSGGISIDKIILEKKHHFIWHCLTAADLEAMNINIARYASITRGIDEQYMDKKS